MFLYIKVSWYSWISKNYQTRVSHLLSVLTFLHPCFYKYPRRKCMLISYAVDGVESVDVKCNNVYVNEIIRG